MTTTVAYIPALADAEEAGTVEEVGVDTAVVFGLPLFSVFCTSCNLLSNKAFFSFNTSCLDLGLACFCSRKSLKERLVQVLIMRDRPVKKLVARVLILS